MFEFRLARDLGMTVGELRQRMSTAEFAQWVAFYVAEAKERARQEKAARKRR